MAYNQTSSSYTKTYTSFSGCDIVCTFGSVVIGELQAISFSVSREKAPVYTMGSAEPRSFSRGKRGISGTMVFTSFDRDALMKGLQEYATTAASFQRIGGELNMTPISINEWDRKMTSQIGAGSGGAATEDIAREYTKKAAVTATPHYADEVPPFDVTISFVNEYGQKAVMVIYGCEILNEGSGFSIDTIISEKACTFVARRLDPMVPVED